MMQKLTDYSYKAGEDTESHYHVIFLHGYGSSGKFMRDYLGQTLCRSLPDIKFHFPDAPIVLGEDESGNRYCSWFRIDDIEKAHDINNAITIANKRALSNIPAVNAYIDRILEQENITEDKLFVIGFSQGATMAYYAALQRNQPVAGVFSLSGGALKKLTTFASMPPVFLAVGEHEKKPYSGVPQLRKTFNYLKNKKFDVLAYILPNQGHDISANAQQKMAWYIKQRINKVDTKNHAPPAP